MIPLVWFLILWLVLVAIFIFGIFLTTIINLRFGMFSLSTYASTLCFLLGSIAMLAFTANFLMTVDWTQTVDPVGGAIHVFAP